MTRTFFIVLALVLAFPLGYVLGDHLGDGLVIIPAIVVNDGAEDAVNQGIAIPLSSQTLIDNAYMDADGLNTDVREGSAHRPYMPGTARVRMLACFNNAAGDETSACNNATADDLTLPAASGEVYEFAADSQFRHLWLNISTAADADWSIGWQYWNGSAYTALSNVTDGTDGLETAGLNRVSWDFPAAGAWPESTLHSVSGYWVRAEVTSFTSITTAPLGQQSYYETGRWWTLAESLGTSEQKALDVHLDVSGSATTSSFTVAASADDGETAGEDAAYPPPPSSGAADSGTTAFIRRSYNSVNYVINVATIRFDTSSISDFSTVTAATLRCTLNNAVNEDARDLVWEWYSWEGIETSNFASTAQASAHTGTPLTTFGSGTPTEYSFTLTNLHRLNKAGYTGLRAHISGGQPTGDNRVTLAMFDGANSPCELDVTHSPVRDYHYFFPHSGGYTLADTAALEPGSVWELTIAGYFNRRDPGASGNISIVSKSSDFTLEYVGATSEIRMRTNNVNRIGGAISAGYHVVTVTQNGVAGTDDIILLIDGEEIQTGDQSGNGPVTVTDNATDWTFFPDNAVLALEYLEYEVSEVAQVTHQIRELPDHQLDDHTGNGFTVAAHYPDTVSGFTVSLQSAEAPAQDFSQQDTPDVLGEIPAIVGYSDAATSANPTGSFLDALAVPFSQGTGINYQFFTGLIALAISVGLAIAAYRIIPELLIAAIGLFMGMAICSWGLSLVPGWMPFVAPLPILFILLRRKMVP